MVPLLDVVQFPFHVLNAVGVAESVFKNLDQGGQVGKVYGIVFHVGRDLVEDVILNAVDSKAEFFWNGGERGGFQTKLNEE
jgi:hypothetical protein